MKKLIVVLFIMCGVATNSFAQKNGHYKTRKTIKSSVIRAKPATPPVPGVSSATPAIPASAARKRSVYYIPNKIGHAYGHSKNRAGRK